jgi:hypothetical protein
VDVLSLLQRNSNSPFEKEMVPPSANGSPMLMAEPAGERSRAGSSSEQQEGGFNPKL